MKPKLLIVEDEEAIRTQLRSALRDDFTLVFAEGRAEALSASLSLSSLNEKGGRGSFSRCSGGANSPSNANTLGASSAAWKLFAPCTTTLTLSPNNRSCFCPGSASTTR